MKSVLISIQPKWVEKIVNGEKTIEVRKTRPKLETPFKCYIYMSQGDLKDLGLYSEWIYKNRMKVVGEFICDKVYSIKNRGFCFSVATEGESITDEIARQSCLDYDDMVSYLGNKDGYGLHITDLKIYDKPKELSDFISPSKVKKCVDYCINAICSNLGYEELCGAIRRCEYKKLTRPPQSWQYINEL